MRTQLITIFCAVDASGQRLVTNLSPDFERHMEIIGKTGSNSQ
jgi:hypothetical protein